VIDQLEILFSNQLYKVCKCSYFSDTFRTQFSIGGFVAVRDIPLMADRQMSKW